MIRVFTNTEERSITVVGLEYTPKVFSYSLKASSNREAIEKVKSSLEDENKIVDKLKAGGTGTKTIKEYEKKLKAELNSFRVPTGRYSKCPDSGCVQKKPNGKWGVISGKTGKFWDADYDTEDDARAGLRAYFAHKHFSMGDLDLVGSTRSYYPCLVVFFKTEDGTFDWYEQRLPNELRKATLYEIINSKFFKSYANSHLGVMCIPMNSNHPQFAKTVSEYNKFLNSNFK